MSAGATLFAELPACAIREPDLSAHGLLQHFAASSRRARLLGFLAAMDQQDHWATDYAVPLPFDLQRYLQALTVAVQAAPALPHHAAAAWGDLLAQLTSSRSLYLVRYIAERDEKFLDSLGRLLETAASDAPHLAVLRQRFDAFSKAQLLGEIFSTQRLQRIASIMGTYTDD